jgi:hypothetical protein
MGCCIGSHASVIAEVTELSEKEQDDYLGKLKTHTTNDYFGIDSSSSVIVLEVIQDFSVNSQVTSARISLI